MCTCSTYATNISTNCAPYSLLPVFTNIVLLFSGFACFSTATGKQDMLPSMQLDQKTQSA